MRLAVATLALALMLAVAPTSEAEIYRYTDASGREHFTMNLGEVPSEYREAAARQAAEGAKRMQIIAPPFDSRLDAAPTPAKLGPSPSIRPSPPRVSRREWAWRDRFKAQRKSIAKAERELERAEAANETIRAGHSSSAKSAQSRWARQEYRKQKAEERIETATASLEAAEDAMHELRQHAVGFDVPDDWMR